MQTLKQAYWSLLNHWSNWRRPLHTVLSPHDAFDAIEQHLSNDSRSIVIVDGGAHDGVVARQMIERFGNVELHAFEPNIDLFAKLQANLEGTPGSINTCALAEITTQMTLNVNASPMTSSLLERGELSEKYFDAVTQPKQQRTIEAMALDDWAQLNHIEHIDILKLDLQGYEAQALRGATQWLKRGIGCIYTEINFGQVYRHNAQFGDVDAVLREAGYEIYNLYNLSTRNDDGRLLGGDALYLPRADARMQISRRAA